MFSYSKTISCLLHANVCLPNVKRIHTIYGMKRLHVAYDNAYRIMHYLYPEMQVFAQTKLTLRIFI